MNKSPFYFMLCLLFCLACKKPLTPLQQLKKDRKVENSYFIYSSTIRMLNFSNDTLINKLVKDVERITFFNMNPDSFDYDQSQTFIQQLESEQGYELYLELNNAEGDFQLYGKTDPDHFVAMSENEGRYYIFDVKGKPNLLYLPKVVNGIGDRDSSQQDGVSMMFDLIQQDADNEQRWRKRREKRRQERLAKEAKADSIAAAQDTLQQDSIITTPATK